MFPHFSEHRVETEGRRQRDSDRDPKDRRQRRRAAPGPGGPSEPGSPRSQGPLNREETLSWALSARHPRSQSQAPGKPGPASLAPALGAREKRRGKWRLHFEKCVCGCEKGTPRTPQHPWETALAQHTLPGSVGRGRLRAGCSRGPREVWPRSEFPTDLFWGQKSSGKSPPHQTPGPSTGIKSEITSFHYKTGSREPPIRPPEFTPLLPPLPESGGSCGMPPPHGTSAAQKLGAPPGRLPAPAPPSPPPRRSMLSPGPPPALHRRAARLQPAARGHSERPGPTRPRLHGAPSPAWPPPGPSGRRSAGEGPRGDPAPGVRTRAGTRRHACLAGRTLELRSRTQIPSLRGAMAVCLGLGRFRTRRRRVTLYPYLGPGASGSWSLFEHKGPGAAAAALPPPLL